VALEPINDPAVTHKITVHFRGGITKICFALVEFEEDGRITSTRLVEVQADLKAIKIGVDFAPFFWFQRRIAVV
jgi:hypothetical protein